MKALLEQDTKGLFTYSIIIVDNDYARSAEVVVSEIAAISPVHIGYCVEPQQNIARARNRAMANSEGDFVALIDDDEFPMSDWLVTLFRICAEYEVDGVLGPVKSHFDEQPPKWVVRGGFYERPIHPTGALVTWQKARTGNALIKRGLVAGDPEPFRPAFRAGEDQDFFRRQIENGRVFIWSAEAIVYEVIPPLRWQRSYMLRKALLRGATASLQPDCGAISITKSVIAATVYTAALPVALMLGQHRFMSLIVRLCDHLGKLLQFVGINPIQAEYVTE